MIRIWFNFILFFLYVPINNYKDIATNDMLILLISGLYDWYFKMVRDKIIRILINIETLGRIQEFASLYMRELMMSYTQYDMPKWQLFKTNCSPSSVLSNTIKLCSNIQIDERRKHKLHAYIKAKMYSFGVDKPEINIVVC